MGCGNAHLEDWGAFRHGLVTAESAREPEAGTVSVRTRRGNESTALTLAQFVDRCVELVKTNSISLQAERA